MQERGAFFLSQRCHLAKLRCAPYRILFSPAHVGAFYLEFPVATMEARKRKISAELPPVQEDDSDVVGPMPVQEEQKTNAKKRKGNIGGKFK